MNTPEYRYLIKCVANNCSHSVYEWLTKNVQRLSCGHYDDDKLYSPILVHPKEFAHTTTLNTFTIPMTFYLHNDFINLLSPEINNGFQFGDIEILGKGIWTGGRTIYAPVNHWIRSGNESLYWTCDVCGKKVYSGKGEYSYVLRENVKDAAIHMLFLGLLVDQSIYERITAIPNWEKVIKKSRIAILPFPVRDDPLDGFPINLNDTPKYMEREFKPREYKHAFK
jgi:hypothetical protein